MRYRFLAAFFAFALIFSLAGCNVEALLNDASAAARGPADATDDISDQMEYTYATNSKNPVPLGTPHIIGNLQITLLEMRQEDAYGELRPKDDYGLSDKDPEDYENYTFWVCRVRVENMGDEAYNLANPMYGTNCFSLILDGTTADPSTIFVVDGELLTLSEYSDANGLPMSLLTDSAEIEPGNSKEGDILFMAEKDGERPGFVRYEAPTLVGLTDRAYFASA